MVRMTDFEYRQFSEFEWFLMGDPLRDFDNAYVTLSDLNLIDLTCHDTRKVITEYSDVSEDDLTDHSFCRFKNINLMEALYNSSKFADYDGVYNTYKGGEPDKIEEVVLFTARKPGCIEKIKRCGSKTI